MKQLLPYPVTLNRLFANVPGKGRVKTNEYKAWINQAGWELVRQLCGQRGENKKIKGKFTFSMRPLRPDKRVRDIDNLSKGVFDLLKTHGVIEDDALCEIEEKRWRYDGPPGIAIKITPFDGREESFDDWWTS